MDPLARSCRGSPFWLVRAGTCGGLQPAVGAGDLVIATAAIRGGDLVCRGSVGSRTGIDQKGGTIIVGGRVGAFTGFMMQRGRMVILGDAGINLGDSMYDGTIYVGGEVEGLGVDCVPGEMTELDAKWLGGKLALYGMDTPNGVENMKKFVSGKQLWNYDNLEPTEKKLVL